MNERSNFKIDMNKTYYNKAVSEDGLHYEVDTEKKYPAYEVSLYKMYRDIENKEELKKQMIDDLVDVLRGLGYTEIDDLRRKNQDIMDYLRISSDCDEEFEL